MPCTKIGASSHLAACDFSRAIASSVCESGRQLCGAEAKSWIA